MKRTTRTIRMTLALAMLVALALAARPLSLAAAEPNDCETLLQPNYVAAWHSLYGLAAGVPSLDPNGPAVLSARSGDPTVWTVPCGPWRRQGYWQDPEGRTVTLEVIASDLPCEATAAVEGLWTLTVPQVTAEWHVICVRATDDPPPGARPATRDVLVVFRGVPGVNCRPILW